MNINFELATAKLVKLRDNLQQRLQRPSRLAKGAFLQTYLNVIIKQPVDDQFRMSSLPDNRLVDTIRPLGLYDLVPHPKYARRMALLDLIMNSVEYDLDLDDDPRYDELVGALLDSRYPVKEVGEFRDLRHFLQGRGSFWLQDAPARGDDAGRYVVDLDRYRSYAVRAPYRRYGGRAVVDADFNVVSVDGIRAGDDGFDVALAVFRSTLILDDVVHCHAVVCHLLVAQKLYMAASTTYWERIENDAVLRDLYYLCTYRTNDVNNNVPVLVGNKGSLFKMGFGFADESFPQLIKDLVTDPTLQTPADIKTFLIDSRCDHWKRVAEPIYVAVDKFVERVVADKLPDDFKLQTKVALFVSTFYHEIVGDLQLKTVFNCDLNSRTYAGDLFNRRTDEFAYIAAAETVGVSTRILKLCDLVQGGFLKDESLKAWTMLFDDFSIALKPHQWINVHNLEFSVGY